MATFACPFCRKSFLADATAAPQPVNCPHCRQLFEIASQASAPPLPVIPQVHVHPINQVGQSPFGAMASTNSGFECPFCHTRSAPYRRSQVSTAGWVTLIALLITCFPFFWIGLFMKEDVHSCRSCGIKLG